jgi:hypothetical protein
MEREVEKAKSLIFQEIILFCENFECKGYYPVKCAIVMHAKFELKHLT